MNRITMSGAHSPSSFFHWRIGRYLEAMVDDVVQRTTVAFTCHFALDVLCEKMNLRVCNAHLGGKLGIFAPGGLAAAGSLTVVYPLDYARKRLVSDVGSGKKIFDGLLGCLKKTASVPKGFLFFLRWLPVCCSRHHCGDWYPWKNDTGMMGFFFTSAAATDSHSCRRWYISYPFRHCPWAPSDAGGAAS